MATSTEKIRYLVSRPGRRASSTQSHDATRRWFWCPDDALRQAGWVMQRLPDGEPTVRVGKHLAPAAAVAKARDINAQVDAWRRGEQAVHAPQQKHRDRGTLGAIVTAYKRSAEFAEREPRTRRGYEWCLDIIDRWAGDKRAADITPKMCKELYRSLGAPVAANGKRLGITHWPKAAAVIRVLRLLFSWAISEDLVRQGHEPAREVTLKGRTSTAAVWTDAAIAAFVDAADALGLQSLGTALMVNVWIGQRETDLIAIPRQNFDGALLTVRQNKRKRTVRLDLTEVPPALTRLEAELARQTKLRQQFKVTGTTLLLCERTGMAWNEDTFRDCVASVKAAAVAKHPELTEDLGPGVTFRHSRHTAVTRMAEAGVDNKGIASVTGHSMQTIEQLLEDHYLVFTAKLAKNALRVRLASERAES